MILEKCQESPKFALENVGRLQDIFSRIVNSCIWLIRACCLNSFLEIDKNHVISVYVPKNEHGAQFLGDVLWCMRRLGRYLYFTRPSTYMKIHFSECLGVETC